MGVMALIALPTGAAACPGSDYAACMSEDDLTAAILTKCLTPAGSVSELGTSIEATGYTLLTETRTSMMDVRAYRDASTKNVVVLSADADGTLTCTVSTGEALPDGLAKRVSAALESAGYALLGTSESWDGTMIYQHMAGDQVGEVGLSLPDPAFDGTIDVMIERQVAFE